MSSNIDRNLEKFNDFKMLNEAIKGAGLLSAKADAIYQNVSLFLKKMSDKGLEPDRFIDELDRVFSEAVRLGRSMDDRMLMLDEICNQDSCIILDIPSNSLSSTSHIFGPQQPLLLCRVIQRMKRAHTN